MDGVSTGLEISNIFAQCFQKKCAPNTESFHTNSEVFFQTVFDNYFVGENKT